MRKAITVLATIGLLFTALPVYAQTNLGNLVSSDELAQILDPVYGFLRQPETGVCDEYNLPATGERVPWTGADSSLASQNLMSTFPADPAGSSISMLLGRDGFYLITLSVSMTSGVTRDIDIWVTYGTKDTWSPIGGGPLRPVPKTETTTRAGSRIVAAGFPSVVETDTTDAFTDTLRVEFSTRAGLATDIEVCSVDIFVILVRPIVIEP
jgi:hypothetical protein